MKDSGIEWIGKIPAGWKIEKAKYTFAQRSERGNNISLQLLSPTQNFGVIPQVKYDALTGMKSVKLHEGIELHELKTIHKGDFCISLRSFQGGFEYSIYEGVVSPAYRVFYATKQIVEKYYKYLFKSVAFIQKICSYTTSFRDGKTISFESFANLLIPIPPLPEQQRIADYLDKQCSIMDKLAENLQQQIEKLKEYKQSVITEAVTKGLDPNVAMKDSGVEWIGVMPTDFNTVRIKYVFSIIGGCGFKEELQGYSNGKYPFYKASDLANSTIYISAANNYVDEDTVIQEQYKIIPRNSILLPKIGEAMKKNRRCINVTPCIVDNNCQGLVLNTNDNLQYLYYTLSCVNMIWFDNGGTVPCVNNLKLLNAYIPLPPLPEQQRIANYLDKKCEEIDKLIKIKQEKIDKLSEYKKSLIYECVTGKREVAHE